MEQPIQADPLEEPEGHNGNCLIKITSYYKFRNAAEFFIQENGYSQFLKLN